MPESDWTILLSGPVAQRGPLLATLDREGLDVSWQPTDPTYGLPTDDTTGWVVTRHSDVDEVTGHAHHAGWVLRMHWPTPVCKACGGLGQVNGDDGLTTCEPCAGVGATHKPTHPPEGA